MDRINAILEKVMDKLPQVLGKVNKYSGLSLTFDDIKKYAIIGFIALLILFLYFEKSSQYTKDNFLKWDNFSYFKLTLYMVVPILVLLNINREFTSNPIYNNWIHFFMLFLIIPIIPYVALCIYRVVFVIIRGILRFIIGLFKPKKVKEA